MGERWPEPVTPLTWSTALDMTNRNMRYGFRDLWAPYLDHIQWAARFYGRVYLNEGAMAHVMTCERIRDGQSLLVDGTSGRVYIEDGASEAVGTVEEE